MFGKESKGLPESLLAQNPDTCVRIPMRPNLRSLNLSNSVAIAVYEVFRQNNFEGLLLDIAKQTKSISKSCKKQIEEMEKAFKENSFTDAS